MTRGFSNVRTPVKTPRKVGRRHSPEQLAELAQQGALNRKERRALKLGDLQEVFYDEIRRQALRRFNEEGSD